MTKKGGQKLLGFIRDLYRGNGGVFPADAEMQICVKLEKLHGKYGDDLDLFYHEDIYNYPDEEVYGDIPYFDANIFKFAIEFRYCDLLQQALSYIDNADEDGMKKLVFYIIHVYCHTIIEYMFGSLRRFYYVKEVVPVNNYTDEKTEFYVKLTKILQEKGLFNVLPVYDGDVFDFYAMFNKNYMYEEEGAHLNVSYQYHMKIGDDRVQEDFDNCMRILAYHAEQRHAIYDQIMVYLKPRTTKSAAKK